MTTKCEIYLPGSKIMKYAGRLPWIVFVSASITNYNNFRAALKTHWMNSGCYITFDTLRKYTT